MQTHWGEKSNNDAPIPNAMKLYVYINHYNNFNHFYSIFFSADIQNTSAKCAKMA